MKKVRKAVFPVAGLGTRILPATKAVPKELLTVVDKPLIQYAVEEALAAGVEQIIFVTGSGKTALEDHFDRSFALEASLEKKEKFDVLKKIQSAELKDGALACVRQSSPAGLGHAVWCARHLVGDEPFAVLLPDDYCVAQTPILKQMTDMYNEIGGNIVAVTEVPRDQTDKYGILEVGKDDGKLAEVKGLVEKPKPEKAPSNLSVIGRYILQPEIFKHLEEKQIGAGGEIQLTDAMSKLIGAAPFHGLRYQGNRYDCGDKSGYVKAVIATALRREDLASNIRDFMKEI